MRCEGLCTRVLCIDFAKQRKLPHQLVWHCLDRYCQQVTDIQIPSVKSLRAAYRSESSFEWRVRLLGRALCLSVFVAMPYRQSQKAAVEKARLKRSGASHLIWARLKCDHVDTTPNPPSGVKSLRFDAEKTKHQVNGRRSLTYSNGPCVGFE